MNRAVPSLDAALSAMLLGLFGSLPFSPGALECLKDTASGFLAATIGGPALPPRSCGRFATGIGPGLPPAVNGVSAFLAPAGWHSLFESGVGLNEQAGRALVRRRFARPVRVVRLDSGSERPFHLVRTAAWFHSEYAAVFFVFFGRDHAIRRRCAAAALLREALF